MNRKSKRIRKLTHKKTKHYKKQKKTRHHLRKHRQLRLLPDTKGMELFSIPVKKHSQKILLNENQFQSGNMIKGLREL